MEIEEFDALSRAALTPWPDPERDPVAWLQRTVRYLLTCLSASPDPTGEGEEIRNEILASPAMKANSFGGIRFSGGNLMTIENTTIGDNPFENKVGPNSGPKTSRSAAYANYPRSGSQRRRVLQMIQARGLYGATREDIEFVTKIAANSVRPRVLELIQGGWVKVVPGRTRLTAAGEPSEVLVVTDKTHNYILPNT